MSSSNLTESPRLGTTYRSLLLPHLGVETDPGRVSCDVGGRTGAWLRSCGSPTSVVVDLEVDPGPGINGVRGSGLQMPLRTATVDNVYNFDVIEHVPDDRQLLDELARVLRPGGRVDLTTPDHRIAVFPSFLQGWVDRRWGHERVRGYEASHLTSLLEDAGFTDVSVTKIGMRAYRWFYFPLRALWSVNDRLGGRAVALCAAVDARFAEGDRGFLLATARRT